MLQLPAGKEASLGEGAPQYVRHRPERTLLYQLIEEYFPEDAVVIKKILMHLEEEAPTQAALLLPDSRAPPQSGLFG